MKILMLLCLIMPLQAFSETSVWRVSKGESELFIGGTVHVLGKNDFPLPVEFNKAYHKAKMLVFETDLNGMNKPGTQAQLLKRLMYPKGDNLKKHLKPATYHALAKYLKTVDNSISSLQQFKPTLVMLVLTIAELQRLNIADAGVDDFFNKRALADGKHLGQLESIEKQMDVLENMGKGHEDELILSTLNDLKNFSATMKNLKSAWRSGNLKQIELLGITPLVKDYPALYQMVLVERNLSWLPQIEAFLKTPEIEFVLVGAAHLAGKDGLVAQLLQRGYKIEPYGKITFYFDKAYFYYYRA